MGFRFDRLITNAPSARDLDNITDRLDEKSEKMHALWLSEKDFKNIYNFLIRFMSRYNIISCKVLFTLVPTQGKPAVNMSDCVQIFGDIVTKHLRKSDLMMQTKPNQLFVLLPDLREENVTKVVDRINTSFDNNPALENVDLLYTFEMIYPETNDENSEGGKRTENKRE